jgi:actin-related protein
MSTEGEEDAYDESINESSESDLISTVVFDIGTRSCKVGLASSNFPEVNCPSIIGLPRYNGKISSELCSKEEIYIGKEALSRC